MHAVTEKLAEDKEEFGTNTFPLVFLFRQKLSVINRAEKLRHPFGPRLFILKSRRPFGVRIIRRSFGGSTMLATGTNETNIRCRGSMPFDGHFRAKTFIDYLTNTQFPAISFIEILLFLCFSSYSPYYHFRNFFFSVSIFHLSYFQN